MNSHQPDSELSPAAAANVLLGVFGVDFAVYADENGWAPILGSCQPFESQLDKSLQAADLDRPAVHDLADSNCCVIIPISWFDHPTVGVGVVNKTTSDMLNRLSQAAEQLLEQHRQLNLQSELFRE